MATSATQERLAAARKRARDQLTAERQVIEDQVLRYHRAALEIEDLSEQLKTAETGRDEAVQDLLGTGRSSAQVADLLGVTEAELGLTAGRANGSAKRPKSES